jgi:hypothetical protein
MAKRATMFCQLQGAAYKHGGSGRPAISEVAAVSVTRSRESGIHVSMVSSLTPTAGGTRLDPGIARNHDADRRLFGGGTMQFRHGREMFREYALQMYANPL